MHTCPRKLLHLAAARSSLAALLARRAMLSLPPATGPEPHVRSAPFGLLAVDELRRHLGAWPHDGSVCRPRARPDTPRHAEHALSAALDAQSPAAVARALADLFKLVPVPASFSAAVAAATAAGRASPPAACEPALLAAVSGLHAALERRFAAALAPVPVVLGALRELTLGGDASVRHEVVLFALRACVSHAAGGHEWAAQRDHLGGALLYLPLAGLEAAVEVFDVRDPPLPFWTQYALALCDRRWLKDVARLLSSHRYAHVAAVLDVTPVPARRAAAAPGSPAAATTATVTATTTTATTAAATVTTATTAATAAAAADEVHSVQPPAPTIVEWVFELLLSYGKFDLLRRVARGTPHREQALVRFLYRTDAGEGSSGGGGGGGRHAMLAGRLAREFRLDLAAMPDVRAALKRDAVSGLLRLPARDLVLCRARADPEVAQQLQLVVDARVAAGKTTPAHAAAFHAAAEAFWRAADAHQSPRWSAGQGSCGGAGSLPAADGWGGDAEGAEVQRARRGLPVERALSAVDAAAHALYRASRGRGRGGGASTEAPPLPAPPKFCIPAPPVVDARDSVCEGGEEEEEAQAGPAASPVAVAKLTAFAPWPGAPFQLLHDEQGFLRLPTPRALRAVAASCEAHAEAAGGPPLLPAPVELRDVATLEQLRGIVATVHGGATAGGAAARGAQPPPSVPLLALDCEWVSPLVPSSSDADAGGDDRSSSSDDSGAVAVLTIGFWSVQRRHHVWLVDLPALTSAVRGDPHAQAALNAAFEDLLCSPGLAPGKAPLKPGGGGGAAPVGPPAGVRVCALVYGGSQDFGNVAGAHAYLTAFRHTRLLDALPPSPLEGLLARGVGVEAAPPMDAHPPSPSSSSSIAYIDLMRFAQQRQVSPPAFHVPPQLSQPPLETPLAEAAAVVDEDAAAPLGGTGSMPADEDAAAPLGGSLAPAAAVGSPAAAGGSSGGGGIQNDPGSGGLAGLCQRVLGRPISKYWQMSYWLRRPLLAGQAEYAALDAYVLPLLLARLGELPPRAS